MDFFELTKCGGLSPETKAIVAAQEPVGSPVSAVEPSEALSARL
jgi:hypothetical protein